MTPIRVAIPSVALAALLGLCAISQAQMSTPNSSTMTAQLSGASEVPPTTGSGSGTLQATLDKQTRVLTWSLTIAGLSGPPTAAHFHGPAMAGGNAGVASPMVVGLRSPDNGVVTLTAAQMEDLLAGKWYVNVHTAANPNGEIRGQVMVGP
jgi:CHRD domain